MTAIAVVPAVHAPRALGGRDRLVRAGLGLALAGILAGDVYAVLHRPLAEAPAGRPSWAAGDAFSSSPAPARASGLRSSLADGGFDPAADLAFATAAVPLPAAPFSTLDAPLPDPSPVTPAPSALTSSARFSTIELTPPDPAPVRTNPGPGNAGNGAADNGGNPTPPPPPPPATPAGPLSPIADLVGSVPAAGPTAGPVVETVAGAVGDTPTAPPVVAPVAALPVNVPPVAVPVAPAPSGLLG
jgi:hypothetical protein